MRAFILVASIVVASQAVAAPPSWAYGYKKAPATGETAPPCPPGARPFDCAYPATPAAEGDLKRQLPGTPLVFSRNEAYFDYGPADWYPGDHPAMPKIVAQGVDGLGVEAAQGRWRRRRGERVETTNAYMGGRRR